MSILASRVESLISNTPPASRYAKWAGIIGDRSSLYAKSPVLWNAAFQQVKMEAIYHSLDVEEANLPHLMEALREDESFLGGSVTVPYKIKIMNFLDRVDPLAQKIGAVNCVAHSQDGRLTGYNTDGQGAIDALTKSLPDRPTPPFRSLKNKRVVLLGYGGAARAVAFFVADAMESLGDLVVVGRDMEKAQHLADSLRQACGLGRATGESEIGEVIQEADLVINATTKGQSGWRQLGGGRIYCLEPYCALGPANPASVPQDSQAVETQLWRQWYQSSASDIEANLRFSHQVLGRANPEAFFFDLIYSPLETQFLKLGRLAGYAVLNGKWMNIAQAVDAFVNKVCSAFLARQGYPGAQAYDKVFHAMTKVW